MQRNREEYKARRNVRDFSLDACQAAQWPESTHLFPERTFLKVRAVKHDNDSADSDSDPTTGAPQLQHSNIAEYSL